MNQLKGIKHAYTQSNFFDIATITTIFYMATEAYVSLKRERNTCVTELVRCQDELERELTAFNKEGATQAHQAMLAAYEALKHAHEAFADATNDADAKAEIELHFAEQVDKVTAYNNRMASWPTRTEDDISESIRSYRADRAAAEAKASRLKEAQEIARIELEIKLRKEALAVQAELDELAVRGRVYEETTSDADDATSRRADVTRPVVSTGTTTTTAPPKEAIAAPPTGAITLTTSTKGVTHVSTTDTPVTVPTSGATAAPSTGATNDDVIKKIDLPKPELLTFDGKPSNYNKFINNFIVNIEQKVSTDGQRLNYLIQHCVGECKEAIEDCGLLGEEAGYTRAREILASYYGSPHIIARSHVEGLINGPEIKGNDVKGLNKLALQMLKCNINLSQLGYASDIDNQENLRQIARRLPYHLRTKWVDVAYKIVETGRQACFTDLSEFIDQNARKANSMYGMDLIEPRAHSQGHKPVKQVVNKATTLTVQSEAAKPSKRACGCCHGDCDNLSVCSKFKSMNVGERLQLNRTLKLCHNCLKYGHVAKECYSQSKCDVPECKYKHHHLLHKPARHKSDRPVASIVCTDTDNEGNYLGIVPVSVVGSNGKTCVTHALIDDGANRTLCDVRLLKKLGLKGEPITYDVATVKKKFTVRGKQLKLTVSALHGEGSVTINNAWSIGKLPLSNKSAVRASEIYRWKHLADLDIPDVDSDVMMILGTDAPGAHIPIEVRSGSQAEPYGVRTLLGWAIRGPAGKTESEQDASLMTIQTSDSVLHKNLERMWTTDFNDHASCDKAGDSVEDRKAMRMMSESLTTENDGHYKIALPWKSDDVKLPCNLPMAHARLAQLKRKLQSTPELHKMYTDTVEGYIKKGYASEVSNGPLPKRVWYLPHHPVTNINKPGKVRVVFDCAAKYKGVSLNDTLLQGPDLMNSLVGVLLRFRQDRIALAGDIEAMFHQVRVVEEDRDALRFLWWPDGHLELEPKVYHMNVHLFGAKSSPSACSYGLKRTAEDGQGKYDNEVISTVNRNFYVDDCLKSVATEEEASQLVADLRALLDERGFRLTKWVSNSKAVLESIPDSECAPSVKNMNLDDCLPCERALGVKWNVESDELYFDVAIKEKEVTRRGILSVVSALFDPCGLVVPVTLPAKFILQELCRLKLDWDEAIPESLADKWKEWLCNMSSLCGVTIPRCLKPKCGKQIVNVQLHLFSDASETGYGACAYIRLTDSDGETTVTLLLGKSRLAPIKPMSIPRLELAAAVVACRLYQQVMRELELKIDQTILWTDSMIVLSYIRNPTKRFKTFVANRLAIIHDVTTVDQWKYVSTDCNPADIASRGIQANETEKLKTWLSGPTYLREDQEEWPVEPVVTAPTEDDAEIRKEATITATAVSDQMPSLLDRYSDITKLKRAVAWLRRYTIYCKNRYLKQSNELLTGELTVEEMGLAESSIVRIVQRDCFKDEIEKLQAKQHVLGSSKLYTLNPVLVNGIICVGGRLKHSDLGEEAKFPIVLPGRHHVTSLIIRKVHAINGHVGSNQVLAHTREKFWIVRGRAAIRNILNKCIACRRQHGSLCKQQMADLPRDRVIGNSPPFTIVGVDYFGPLNVKVGRAQCKRYGCLFTCLTTRAVHIEIAHSLTTDSFLAAFNRFCSRRGRPDKVYSDNGTNLTSGDAELKASIKEWNNSKISRELLQQEVEWHFSPPHGSHHGGVWERMIRSVRSILKALIKEQLLTDESLLTFMTETEKIINDRPITQVSGDSRDPDALTPNHLLLLKPNSCYPVGIFNKDDLSNRRWWRQAQYLANVFWKRWLKEYLPTLQIRQKWQRPNRNVKVGDIVLIADENVPRGQWPMGRVTSVNVGRDDKVRSCTVLRGKSELVRPIVKLCLLEGSD